MTQDQLERLVTAACRGMMQGVLDAAKGIDVPAIAASQEAQPAGVDLPATAPLAEEFRFPRMIDNEQELVDDLKRGMREQEPETADLEQLAIALQRQREAAMAVDQPQYQPGPGESEVSSWLRAQ